MRSDFTAAVSQPKHVMHNSMTGSLSYENSKPPKSSGIDMDAAIASHNGILAACTDQMAQESQGAGTELLEDEQEEMKSESDLRQSSRNTGNDIITMLDDLSVVTRVEDTEIVESCMAKSYEKIKAEVVETFADTLLKTLCSRVIWT